MSDPNERLAAPLSIRFRPDEREKVDERAALAGMTPSAFVRAMALKGRLTVKPIPEANRDAYLDLARLGNLLNTSIRQGDPVSLPLLVDLQRQVRALQLALLGEEAEEADTP